MPRARRNPARTAPTERAAPRKPRLTDAALPFVPSLTLNFANASSIEAGKPYLVKVAANTDLSAAPFTGAIVSKDAQPFTSTDIDFIPTLGATTIEGSDTKAVLFLAANNTLLNPSAQNTL